MATKRCKVCGKKFETNRKNTVCCSDECKKEFNRIRSRERYKSIKPTTKVCEVCGKIYEPTGRNQKYCCYKCKLTHQLKREKELREKNRTPVIKKCKVCGNEFDSRWGAQICSDECRKVHKRNKRQEHDKRNRQRRIAELNERFDGDLELMLKECPTTWLMREAIMLVDYGVSYSEAMYQKFKSTPVCEVTGVKDDLVIHHLYSFNTHPEKGADLDNLVRVSRKVHDEFHAIYGRGNNTPEQWFEFVESFSVK